MINLILTTNVYAILHNAIFAQKFLKYVVFAKYISQGKSSGMKNCIAAIHITKYKFYNLRVYVRIFETVNIAKQKLLDSEPIQKS